MQSFQDKNGRKWNIELNVGTAKRVKAECGVDLVNAITLTRDGKAQVSELESLAEAPVLLVDVLFSLCRVQAQECGVDDFAFAELFNADAVEESCNALMEEIINFSQPAKRKALTRIYKTAQNVAVKMEKQLEAALDDPELDAEIESVY